MSVSKTDVFITDDGSKFLSKDEATLHENRIETKTIISKTNSVLGDGIAKYSRRIWPKYPIFGVITNSSSSYSDTPAYEAFDSYFLDIPYVTIDSYKSTKYNYPTTLPGTTMMANGTFNSSTVQFTAYKVEEEGTVVQSVGSGFELSLVLPKFKCLNSGFLDSEAACRGGNFSGATNWGYRFPSYQIREYNVGVQTGTTIFILNKLGVNTEGSTIASTEMKNVTPMGHLYYGKTCFLSYSGTPK